MNKSKPHTEMKTPKRKFVRATLKGTIFRLIVMIFLLYSSAIYFWTHFDDPRNKQHALSVMIGGLVTGLFFAILTSKKKKISPITAPLFVLFQGAFIGTYSYFSENTLPDVILQAQIFVYLALLTTFCLFYFEIIRPTEKFKWGVGFLAATIVLYYFSSMILNLFDISLTALTSPSITGIVFSIFVVTIISLTFIIDFHIIQRTTSMIISKYMEWFGAFTVTISLIWLFIESTHLLVKIRTFIFS